MHVYWRSNHQNRFSNAIASTSLKSLNAPQKQQFEMFSCRGNLSEYFFTPFEIYVYVSETLVLKPLHLLSTWLGERTAKSSYEYLPWLG